MDSTPIQLFHRGDSALPRELWEISDPPGSLYVQGKAEALSLLSRLPRDGLAIVGTRHPQPRSLHETRRVISQLEGSARVIVSGFARGIDGEAHRAALEFGIPTIAVLGGGLSVPYPSEHQELRRELLMAGGLLVTEFPPGREPRPGQFLKRNRIIAAWTRATWVVAASYRSGAMNTAKWAREHQREVFATPCYPGDPTLAGNQELLDRLEAQAMWGRFSLGSIWLELATPPSLLPGARPRVPRKEALQLLQGGNAGASHPPSQPPPNLPILEDPRDLHDAHELKRLVQAWQSRFGAATIQDILDGALAQGWSPARFYDAVDLATRLGWIRGDHQMLHTHTIS